MSENILTKQDDFNPLFIAFLLCVAFYFLAMLSSPFLNLITTKKVIFMQSQGSDDVFFGTD